MTPLPPNLVVIGAYKCGTTMLQRFLEQHPDVFVPTVKEPNYWAFAGMSDAECSAHPSARWSIRDAADYLALFDGASDADVVAEVSPEYLPSTHARIRLAEIADERVRFVVILRDPVDRAYSDFMMYRRDGVEPLDDFEAALELQEERRAAGLPTGYYLETGRYARQLAPWFDSFGSDRMLVLLYDDLKLDPHGVASRLYEFAGVDASFVATSTDAVNVSGVPDTAALRLAYSLRRRAGPAIRDRVPVRIKRTIDRLLQQRLTRVPLDADVRSRLVLGLQADIEDLRRLIDQPLDEWSR